MTVTEADGRVATGEPVVAETTEPAGAEPSHEPDGSDDAPAAVALGEPAEVEP